jgi:hypothetical protein
MARTRVQPNNAGDVTTPLSLDVDSTDAALRVTQTGSGDALRVEDSANPDSTPFVVDASGRIAIGGAEEKNRIVQIKEGDSGATMGVPGVVGITMESSLSTGIQIATTPTNSGFIFFSDPDNQAAGRIIYNHNGDYMALNVNATERMRITSAGNVGVGTSSPAYKLDVNGTVNASAVFVNGAPIGGGGGTQKVVQVVVGTTTTNVETTSGTFVDSNLTATITPTSTANNILVTTYQSLWAESLSAITFATVDSQIVRGSTPIHNNANFQMGIYTPTGLQKGASGTVSMATLDSPSTTSATTYKTQFRKTTGDMRCQAQFWSNASTIILMEVTP